MCRHIRHTRSHDIDLRAYRQYDNWDDEGTRWFFRSDGGNFDGELTVTHHTSELYGYAVVDTVAYFETPN